MIWALVTLVGLVGMVAAEAKDLQRGRWIAKPIASTGFVGFGVACGALDSAFGKAVLVALVLSWWGDILLIPKDKRIFMAGILAFLAGHLAYGASFLVLGVDPVATGIAAAAMTVPAVFVGRWIVGHAPPSLRPAVVAYIVVISAMVALATGTVRAGNDPTLLVAACVFYLSDLAVARERFVQKSFANKAWGLPAYYGAQLLFGLAVLHYGAAGS